MLVLKNTYLLSRHCWKWVIHSQLRNPILDNLFVYPIIYEGGGQKSPLPIKLSPKTKSSEDLHHLEQVPLVIFAFFQNFQKFLWKIENLLRRLKYCLIISLGGGA